MSEIAILKQSLLGLSSLCGVTVWRNNTGALPDRHTGRLITFGLPGSGDILGIRKIRITPEMVGQDIGIFISVECKTAKGKQTEQQRIFEKMILDHGGIYVLARSGSDAVQGVLNWYCNGKET